MQNSRTVHHHIQGAGTENSYSNMYHKTIQQNCVHVFERKEKEYLLGEVVFVIIQFIQRVRKEVARPACRQIFDTVANT